MECIRKINGTKVNYLKNKNYFDTVQENYCRGKSFMRKIDFKYIQILYVYPIVPDNEVLLCPTVL